MMTMIEAVGEVGPDRRLVIKVPKEISQGSHRVMLMVLDDDEGNEEVSKGAEVGLEWENGLLVYNGPISEELDIPQMITRHREERMSSVMFGDGE